MAAVASGEPLTTGSSNLVTDEESFDNAVTSMEMKDASFVASRPKKRRGGAGDGVGRVAAPRRSALKKQRKSSAIAEAQEETTSAHRGSSAEVVDDEAEEQLEAISPRPAYMSVEREKEVMRMAERMQGRDLTAEVPVASFAYEILVAHPSVREMGLRERMDFLLLRWNKLSKKRKTEYINDPLKGLL